MGFMSEVALVRCAMAAAVVGIFLLYLIIHVYAPAEVSPGEGVFIQDEGSSLSIIGVVQEDRRLGNLTRVTALVEIPVIAFSEVHLDKGQKVLIQGRVSEYEGERQVVATRISIVK